MNTPLRIAICLALAWAATGLASADLGGTTWSVTLETRRLGPIETYLAFEPCGDSVCAHSLSGAIELIRAQPRARTDDVDLSPGLFAFTVHESAGGWTGETSAPWSGRTVSLAIDGHTLTGSIDGGLFGGPVTGTLVGEATMAELERIRDYPSIVAVAEQVVESKLFDPDDLETEAYLDFRRRLGEIAAAAKDDLDLLLGFRFAWANDPFSHFELRRATTPAAAIIESFDSYDVGEQAARVVFDGDLAVLTVDTMMGNDTIEHIRAGYREIAAKGSKALVIDLRGNGGGAFAVKPLVEHVIDQPLEPGYFISHGWNVSHDQAPTSAELAAIEPWQGWSLKAFWEGVQEEDPIKLRFEPAEPNFDGPVFVLVDGDSASATELAADAFRSSGVTTLVGERTVGHMLSQSFFDASDGFIVSLPVADYYSTAHGRIEGAGVPVDIESASADALDRAKELARVTLGNTIAN